MKSKTQTNVNASRHGDIVSPDAMVPIDRRSALIRVPHSLVEEPDDAKEGASNAPSFDRRTYIS